MNISWIKTFKISIYLWDDKAVYDFFLSSALPNIYTPARLGITKYVWMYFKWHWTNWLCARRTATCRRKWPSSTPPSPLSSGSRSRRSRSSKLRMRRRPKPSSGSRSSWSSRQSSTLWRIISCEYFVDPSSTLLNWKLFKNGSNLMWDGLVINNI